MYDNFPKIIYNKQAITDISRRFIIDTLDAKYQNYYYYYTIQNWISVDNLAYNIYQDSSLEWLIRLVNNIDNIFDNVSGDYEEGEYLPEANQLWLLRPSELSEYIKLKYPNKSVRNTEREYTYLTSQYPHHYTKDNLNYQYFELNPLLSDNYLNNLRCMKEYLQDNFGYSITSEYKYLQERFSKCTVENIVLTGYYTKEDNTYIAPGSFDINGENVNLLKIENKIANNLELKAISNAEYETNLNESRRKIKIIYPELVGDIESEVKKLFNT